MAEKVERNEPEEFKTAKEIDASKQGNEYVPPETFSDERSRVVKRLHFFVRAFINEFGEKLDQYTAYLNAQRPNNKNAITTNKHITNMGMVLTMIPQVKVFASGFEYFVDKNRTNKATEIIKRLEDDCRYIGVDLERTVIRLGCAIFQNFEHQCMALDDGQLQESRALAADAVERIMSCLSTYVNPENHEISPDGYCKFLYRCFLEGKSKGLIGNYIPLQKIRHHDHKIKISNVYKNVGLAILDNEFKVVKYFKKKGKKSNSTKYGYRLCSLAEYENEQDMDTKIRKLYEEESKPETAYKYLLRPDDINKTVEQFLKEHLLKETFFVKHILKAIPVSKMTSKL